MEIYIPAVSKILHKTSVDFASRALPKVVHIVQYDNKLPVLEVQLFANSTPYTIPENAAINLRFKKKDRTFIIIQAAGCDESRQVVYFEVSNQMTVDHGFFYSVIEVSIGEEIAASGHFGIEIDRNPVQDDDVKSTYEFKALEQYVKDAQKAAEQTKDDRAEIEKYFSSAIVAKKIIAEMPVAPYNDCDTLPSNSCVSYAYYVNSSRLSNKPDNFNNGTIVTLAPKDGTSIMTQIAVSSKNVMWHRAQYGGVWTGWLQEMTDESVHNREYTTIAMFDHVGIVGDSFASGATYGVDGTRDGVHYGVAWGRVLSKRNNIDVDIFAASGLSTKTWLEHTNGLTSLLSTMPQDLYLLCLGINDNKTDADPIGTIADINDDDYTQNASTFCGHYGRIVSQILEHAPLAKILFVVPPGYKTNNIGKAISTIAEHYAVPCVYFDDDPFAMSSFYIGNKYTGHPIGITYAGMATAFERLFARCAIDNASYFADFTSSRIDDGHLSAKMAEANATYANAVKATLSGASISVSDVSPLKHHVTIKVHSKNIIPYPYIDTTRTSNGITWTDNGDGTVTANGTATADAFFRFSYAVVPYKTGDYILSGCPSGGSGKTYYIYTYDGAARPATDYGFSNAYSKIAVYDSAKTYSVYAMIAKGAVANNLVFKPQLEYGAIASTYTPYVPDLTSATVKVGRSPIDSKALVYTPNADGTVSGVTSLASSMTISGSTGVIVDVTYSRDTNSVLNTLYISTNGKGYNPEADTYYVLTSTLFETVKTHLPQYKIYLASDSHSYPCNTDITGESIRISCMVYDNTSIVGDTYTTYYVGTWTSVGIAWDVFGTRSDPCLIEGTPINMADGSEIAVENLRTGDIVQSYDPVTGKNIPAVVIAAYATGADRKYTVYSFANGKHLTIYGMHGFYDKASGTTKDIRNITMNDKPVDISGVETQLITSRELLFHGEKKRRYNVITSNNLYFANDILLGSKPFSRMQYVLDYGLDVPEEIRAVWQKDTDDYNKYSNFLNNPEYHAEISEAYCNLENALHRIEVNKKRLFDSDYKVQKFTEGLLSLAEWSEAKTKRAAWRKAVNDNEVLRDTAKAMVNAIIAKYRGNETPRDIFETCCVRDNALFETVKTYFTSNGGGNA